MIIEIPPMKIVSDNERLVPVIMGKGEKKYPRNVTSKVYDKCKESLIRIMQAQIPSDWKPGKNVAVTLFVHTYKDITNILKILMDALEGAGGVENDRYITTLFVLKHPVKRGQLDEVRMTILNMEEE